MKRSQATEVLIVFFSLAALLSLFPGSSDASNWNEGSILIAPDESDDLTLTGSPIRTGHPGDELYFTLWVSNDHSEGQRVVLSVAEGPGWTTVVTGSVDIPAESQLPVDLYVSIPDSDLDPNDLYPIRVEGTANLTGDRAFLIAVVEVEIEIDHELNIVPNNVKELKMNVYPGQRTFIDLKLQNTGNMKDVYSVAIMEHHSSWDMQFREGTQELTAELGFEDTDENFRTSLMIKVPSSALEGQNVNIMISSESSSSDLYGVGKVSDLVSIELTVIMGASISVVPTETGAISSQEYIDTTFTLKHSGVTGAVIEPLITVYAQGTPQTDWDILTAPAGPLLLEVGEELEVSVRAVPDGHPVGYFELEFDGISTMADIHSSKVTAYFEPFSNLLLGDLSGAPFDVGEEIIIETTIQNNGDVPEQVLIDVSGFPDDYMVEVTPSLDINIEQDETVHLMIRLEPRGVGVEDPFNLTISVKKLIDDLGGEWGIADEKTMRVDFRELPNLELKDIDIPIRSVDEGSIVCINVTVANSGNLNVKNALVVINQITFGLSNPEIDRTEVDLDPGESRIISFEWTAKPAARSIRARILVPEDQDEMKIDDNEMVEPIYVIPTKVDRDPGNSGGENKIPAETAIAGGAGLVIVTGLLVFFSSKDAIRYPLFLALGPLYSKLHPEHILNNRLRKRIYVYVQNHPGEHFRSILTHLDLTNGTLAHHLYTLEKENLIRSKRDGLYRRFYPAGYQIDETKVSLSAIQRRIMGLVTDEPGLSQKDISQRLQISNSTVNYNIKSLADKGIVDVQKEGKSTCIIPVKNQNS
ncbi:MAG: winged helix-turn-helix transcriptional regulator [Candidatus Thermoplasmatota archaeon]|nr:winged helix-turn-helix transcriptional regulator [Candidatus Thermoplasmatota archaeon]